MLAHLDISSSSYSSHGIAALASGGSFCILWHLQVLEELTKMCPLGMQPLDVALGIRLGREKDGGGFAARPPKKCHFGAFLRKIVAP